MVDGNEDYKTQRLANLKAHFKNMQWGFGDKISDAKAYLDNNIEAILILHLDEERYQEADDIREFVDKLEELPDSVHLVTTWQEVQEVLDGSDAHSRSAMQQRLRQRARKLEQQEESDGWFR